MADTVKIKLLRFDPSVDASPHHEDYEVPYDGGDEPGVEIMTMLSALHYIYEELDEIAYDSNCWAGLCGRCSMMIDGQPRLACWTKVDKGKSYTVEPLRGIPVVRDLVVDKRANYEKFVASDIAVQSRTPINELVNIPYELYWDTLETFNLCRECQCCYAACPKVYEGLTEKFIGPGAMMQIAMRFCDPCDEADRPWQAAFAGVFECDLCGKCSSVCPAEIDIVKMMKTLQDAATAEGLGANVTEFDSGMLAVAEEIASANGSSASALQQASGTVEEIIQTSCGTSGCHDAETLLAFKTDADSASLRVKSHVASQIGLSEEQAEAFTTLFTK
ncbi:MAG: hypothetical protein LBH64_04790 [Coriobacteriales bacterium]|jgi:succinate dehydrogenase/fumarate reductase iron-sulfur protein|nr:hypothetical protein [Coriobacteriales bacterium]